MTASILSRAGALQLIAASVETAGSPTGRAAPQPRESARRTTIACRTPPKVTCDRHDFERIGSDPRLGSSGPRRLSGRSSARGATRCRPCSTSTPVRGPLREHSCNRERSGGDGCPDRGVPSYVGGPVDRDRERERVRPTVWLAAMAIVL